MKIINTIIITWCLLYSMYGFSHVLRKDLIVINRDGRLELKPEIGKEMVEQLLIANGKTRTTTSCRLENKRVVAENYLNDVLHDLEEAGCQLEERETKNLPVGARAGTLTLYGSSLKFTESKNLPKTSIKMRIRAYLVEKNGEITRAESTKNQAFLEIKIKNPFPEYPLSVHKYRLMMPDEDLLMLVKADPAEQKSFVTIIEQLKTRARERDPEGKESQLIEAMFESIKLMAIAVPEFIKPEIGLSYYRISKKYDEQYVEKINRKRKLFGSRIESVNKTRSYEITIDQDVKAYRIVFHQNDTDLGLEKYIKHNGVNKYLLAVYPAPARVVEFKQPDAIGYQGPGVIRRPEHMRDAQKKLWTAFVGQLGERAWPRSTPDKGKFGHVKQFLRMQGNQAKPGDTTMLLAPGKADT